ncbi:MAG: stage III sporulation protein AE [Clostridia bacterium]|nr:stage III sporulation protein AE [Clostridia bacterium]
MEETYVTLPDTNTISTQGREFLENTLPGFDFTDFVDKITSGENIFEADNILNMIIKIFADEMYSTIRILSVILAIVAVSSLLENLRTSFNKENLFNAGTLCVVMITGLSIEIFTNSCDYAKVITDDITNVMWSILPVMMTLVSGSGHTTTGVITHPILLFMCNVFAEIFDKVLIPVSVMYLAISLTDTMSETIELGKLRELIRKTYNFLLGLIMTLFTGLLGISSFAGVTLDSVGAKGVKFAVSNMVPFVGRSLSDAMGAVVSASLVLKNAVGITAIVCIVGICIVPIIKTAVVILCVRLSAAVCESVAGKKTIQVLTYVADSLSMVNAAVIATMVMMIISLSIIVGIKS